MLLLLFQIISIAYSIQLSKTKYCTNINFHSSNSIRYTRTFIPSWLLPSKYTESRCTSSYMTLYGTKDDVKEHKPDSLAKKKTRTRQERDSTDIEWHYNYEALKHYLYNQETTSIPISTIYNCTLPVPDEPWNTYNYNGKLGKWLQEQKTLYKQYESNLKEKPIQWLAREKLLQELVDLKLIQWDDAKLMPGSELGYHPWYIHYAALLHYYQVYGTCNVPLKTSYPCILKGYGIRGSSYYYDGHLGKWVNQQLRILNNMCDEKLSPLRIRKFQNLIRKGMLRMYHIYDETSEFERHIKRTTWEQHFDALIQYARIHGTCNVPRKTTFRCILKRRGDNITDYMYNGNLGEWVHRQRLNRQSPWRTALTRDRFKKLQILEDSGIFSIYEDDFMEFQTVDYSKESKDYDWDFHFSALLAYGREYGTCNIPPDHNYLVFISNPDNPNSGTGGLLYMGKLGRWLANHRRKYMTNKLSSYQLSRFMELVNKGMLRIVTRKLDLVWRRHYHALLQYGSTTGHHNIPQRNKFKCILPGMGDKGEDYEYNLKLGQWLTNQRERYHNGRLLYHRKMMLQEIVNKGTLLWNATIYKASSITKSKCEVTWPRNYAALLHYGQVYGTCNIPVKASYECILPGMGDNGEDYHYKGKLGMWLDSQKIQMRDGRLLQERVEKLQQLIDQGLMDMNRRYASTAIQNKIAYSAREWPRCYAALLDYSQKHGTCNIPRDRLYECILSGMGDNGTDYHYKGRLGLWLSNQKRRWKSGLLPPDRIEKFQKLIDQGLMEFDRKYASSAIQKQIAYNEREWPRHYAALLHYSNRYGTCNVPVKESYECILPGMGDNGEDYHYKGNLGLWVRNQRICCKNNKLRADRVEKLQILVDQGLFLWNVSHMMAGNTKRLQGLKDWPRYYAALLHYGDRYGTCNVPYHDSYECILPGMGDNGEDYHYKGRLGYWLSTQRSEMKVGRLSDDRIAKLQVLADQGLFDWIRKKTSISHT